MACQTLWSGFHGLVGSPVPTRGARHQPNPRLVFVLCLLGTTSSWPKEGPCNLTERSFQVLMKPKNASASAQLTLHQVLITSGIPAAKHGPAEAMISPYTTGTFYEGNGRGKCYLNWSHYTCSAKKKSCLSQMLMRWHRLWAGFVLFFLLD